MTLWCTRSKGSNVKYSKCEFLLQSNQENGWWSVCIEIKVKYILRWRFIANNSMGIVNWGKQINKRFSRR